MGSLTPSAAEGDFLRPCPRGDATGAMRSQSWKPQQPVSRHYDNLHTSGYEMERSEKVLYWSPKAQHRARELGSVSELLCSSGPSPCWQARCASAGRCRVPSGCFINPSLSRVGRGSRDGPGSHGAPGGGWEGLAKATQAMNPVPSPALLEGWGLKMQSRTPSAPLLRKENRNRGSASTSRK